MRRGAALFGAWLLLAAYQAPPAAPLGYDLDAASTDDQLAAPSTQPPEPGEQYPPSLADQARPVTPTAPRRPGGADWRLIVDASVVADTNLTNSTDAESVELDLDGVAFPVPLDPSLRQHGGIGVGVSASLRGRVPIGGGVSAAIDAEGFVLEQEGARSDDASVLLAAGAEIQGPGGSTILLQATGFDRRYAGASAMRGFGVRGRYRQPLGEGEALSLFVDARFFDSDYGEEFGGTEGGVYLTYETVIDPTLSGSAGIYVRGSWLGSDSYSSREFGIHGGLSHYLSADLIGGLTAGLGRIEYEGPILLLSPDPRRDWRMSGSLYVASRRPLLIGLTPSLTYTYNRTSSSIEYYRADRHRLRFGLSRTF
ncbi:MAG TPA: surface lipoprotein assembly modifier [Allosphingosinicella sp.]|jgi:hypothetical protein